MLRFVLSVALALVGSVASAQTPFPARIIEAGQTVTVPKGNYTLTQPVVVRFGGTLIVEAGSVIEVAGQGLPISVYGSLRILGTAAEPVVMRAKSGHVCGEIATFASTGKRPFVEARYLDLTVTKAGLQEAIWLDRCDFALEGCRVSNQSGFGGRSAVSVVNTSIGTIASCYLDGGNDVATGASVGLIVGETAGIVQFAEMLVANATTAIDCRKPVALINGSIE